MQRTIAEAALKLSSALSAGWHGQPHILGHSQTSALPTALAHASGRDSSGPRRASQERHTPHAGCGSGGAARRALQLLYSAGSGEKYHVSIVCRPSSTTSTFLTFVYSSCSRSALASNSPWCSSASSSTRRFLDLRAGAGLGLG